ncbi:MAG TPA: sigma-70 family RNA polymerase sigma factor [Clostridiaceae bacterium]|nr:sigma-70 family RNA polymerase sigma factor [Clostridiaceae bacterium]
MKNKNLDELIAEYVLRYKENYYRLAYSYVKNADDAMDIVRKSVYKAISSAGSLKNPDYIKTWLYRIVINTSLDFLRKQRKSVAFDKEALESFDFKTVDDYGYFDLQKALDSLPEEYRTIVILRYFEDLNIEEIAEILNENINTIKIQLYKSLEKLGINLSFYEEV